MVLPPPDFESAVKGLKRPDMPCETMLQRAGGKGLKRTLLGSSVP